MFSYILNGKIRPLALNRGLTLSTPVRRNHEGASGFSGVIKKPVEVGHCHSSLCCVVTGCSF